MTYRKYEVKEDYSPEKNYPVHLRNKITTCLSLMRKGEQFQPIEFARKYQTQLTTSSDLYVAKKHCIQNGINCKKDRPNRTNRNRRYFIQRFLQS